MEEKTNKTFLDPAIDWLRYVLRWDIPHEYHHLTETIFRELKPLRMFIWGLEFWEDLQYDWHVRFSINFVMPKIHQLAKQIKSDSMLYELEEAIHCIRQFKPQVKDICIHLLGGDFKCTSCPSNQKEFFEYARETTSFCHFVQENLRYLQNDNLLAPVMKQHIASIRGKLEELGSYVEPVNLSITRVKKLYGLISHARTWCNRIACLTSLYWAKGRDDSLTSFMETVLFGLLHRNVTFNTSGVISSNSPRTMIPQLLARHLDYLLEGLDIPMKDDLHEQLIFMLSFIMGPPQDDSGNREMICAEIYSIINEFPSHILSVRLGEMKGETNLVHFSDFVLKVDRVKDQVKKLYVVSARSPQCCFPITNITGFLNSMIRDLKEMLQGQMYLVPSLKHQGELLQKQLDLLRPVISNITVLLQDEREEIQDLLKSTINTVYIADYFIKLCHSRAFYLWYGMIGLPDFVEDLKSIKIESHKLIGVDNFNKKQIGHHDQMEGTSSLRPRGSTSEIEKDYINFIEDERVVIDELTRGQKSLTIISISGSGGQGKTTFAKRIYNDPNVRYHFQKSVWCYISKDCPVKEILVQIIGDIDKGSVKKMEMQDLIQEVWRSFKGRRYLIVMDDIWDIDAWRNLERSFPDDKNGSRILFTSRNHDLASETKSNWISHPLPLFSDEQSWELMKKRVFGTDGFREEFDEIGKKIASYCKGLPLAVVLIAAVLGRTEQNLDLWTKVAENLKSHLAEEGCGNVIDLSYKYLPDHLKSCFLYFGAFPRGENVRAKELKLLWIGEGFIIQDGKAECSQEDLATEYLKILVSQGLVGVAERGSMGGIKSCVVHDLLYDLCLEKCKEDCFFKWAEAGSMVVDDIRYINHHRLCIGKSDPFFKSGTFVAKKELPTSPLRSFLWSTEPYEVRKSSLCFLESFRNLTTLKLNLELKENVHEFPEEILSCIYLRYLALELNISGAVPLAIANLWKLRTFIIATGNSMYVAECLWYMAKAWPLSDLRLPACMWYMESLRHVDVEYAYLDFEGFDQKHSSIETLGTPKLDKDDNITADFLRRFPNLRKLSCEVTARTGHILELFSMVGSVLTQLESLNVRDYRWKQSRYRYKENPNLNPNIRNLPKIKNLNKLSLYHTYLPWSVVSEIGKLLPNLYVLKLLSASCEGESWKLEDGDFSKLIYLKLSWVMDIKEFDVSSCDENPPFPNLEHLVLDSCEKLGEIPSVFGEINTLKTIELRTRAKELENSAMTILEEQREFGNKSLQVFVNGRSK